MRRGTMWRGDVLPAEDGEILQVGYQADQPMAAGDLPPVVNASETMRVVG